MGTISIEASEFYSELLKRQGIDHQVLNAKYHEQEAEIIKQAGQPGMVTIATNMAGRGTDIVLGDGVVELGGLHVIGTERHESRRIDNQPAAVRAVKAIRVLPSSMSPWKTISCASLARTALWGSWTA